MMEEVGRQAVIDEVFRAKVSLITDKIAKDEKKKKHTAEE